MRGDLTRGPILRALVLFMVPALATSMLQTVGGTINAIWVGQLLGTTAVAATANANLIMMLMYGAVFGFGMATTIAVGKCYGARDLAGARRAFGGGIGFAAALATTIAIAGWAFSPWLLAVMATPPEVRIDALAYLRITFLSLPFMSVSMMIGLGMRGAGDVTTSMISSIVATVLDIALNPVLILGLGPFPRFGIAGAALAGALAAFAGTALMVAVVYVRDLPLRLKGAELLLLLPDRAQLRYMLAKGLPMGAQATVTTTAGLVFIGLVNREGVLATAAYGASLQLWNYIQMPAIIVGQAVSTMVAQNIGARQHDRVARINWTGLGLAEAITGTLTAIVLLFDLPVLQLFLGAGSPAVPMARHIQMICSWTYMLSGVMMVLFATMRAYGSVMVPLVVMFISLYPARLGFYALAYPSIGSEAVWWSFPVGSAVSVVLALLAYRFGSWRHKRDRALAAQAG